MAYSSNAFVTHLNTLPEFIRWKRTKEFIDGLEIADETFGEFRSEVLKRLEQEESWRFSGVFSQEAKKRMQPFMIGRRI